MPRSHDASALQWHLAFNFYPALTPKLLEPCQAAIAAIREGDPCRAIDINGTPLSAGRIAEDLHLTDFIDDPA